ncbi:MAG: prepilin-type N-terminal cleavage/methylation domain-containing protein [Desulfobulbales bacterium]|nr:prepilin-type N-terminal cleavage/methylation domain-containing protein [Desulfobulbales bacterium]
MRNSKGFTLIELIMSIIILGFVSLIMIPFVTSIGHGPDPAIRQRAISLGQALLDEIIAKKWDENSPTGGGPICTTESPDQTARPSLIDNCVTVATPVATLGSDAETRIDFDDVDDYDGLTASDNFIDQSGAGFSLPGYSRAARVTYIASDSNPVTAASPAAAAVTTDTKRIVVTVVSPRQETMKFVALACNY